MPEQMRVVIVRPGEAPEVTSIDNTLESMQEVVGGYIQAVNLRPHIALICNEDGIAMELPPNRMIGGHRIYGTCFLVGVDAPEFVSLSAEEADALARSLAQS